MNKTRPGVDKVKPKGWFKYSLKIDKGVVWDCSTMHLVLLSLNLSILDAGILKMVQQISLMMFSLNMVGYHMSLLLLST